MLSNSIMELDSLQYDLECITHTVALIKCAIDSKQIIDDASVSLSLDFVHSCLFDVSKKMMSEVKNEIELQRTHTAT